MKWIEHFSKATKKKKVIIAIFAAFVIALIVFSSFQYWQNRTYKNYLSNRLANHLGSFRAQVLSNERLFQNVIDNQTMTPQQHKWLQSNYQSLSSSAHRLIRMAKFFNKLPDDNKNYNNFLEVSIHVYRNDFGELGDKTKVLEKTLHLNEKKIKQYKKINALNHAWIKVIKNDILTDKYLRLKKTDPESNPHLDFKSEIDQDAWIQFIIDLHKETRKWLKPFCVGNDDTFGRLFKSTCNQEIFVPSFIKTPSSDSQ